MPRAAAAAGLVTRQADAGAPTPDEVVLASGMFDKQRARRRALAAMATLMALWKGQERILVALTAGALDRDVGLAVRRLEACRLVVGLLLGLLLLARDTRRRAGRTVLRVPEA